MKILIEPKINWRKIIIKMQSILFLFFKSDLKDIIALIDNSIYHLIKYT